MIICLVKSLGRSSYRGASIYLPLGSGLLQLRFHLPSLTNLFCFIVSILFYYEHNSFFFLCIVLASPRNDVEDFQEDEEEGGKRDRKGSKGEGTDGSPRSPSPATARRGGGKELPVATSPPTFSSSPPSTLSTSKTGKKDSGERHFGSVSPISISVTDVKTKSVPVAIVDGGTVMVRTQSSDTNEDKREVGHSRSGSRSGYSTSQPMYADKEEKRRERESAGSGYLSARDTKKARKSRSLALLSDIIGSKKSDQPDKVVGKHAKKDKVGRFYVDITVFLFLITSLLLNVVYSSFFSLNSIFHSLPLGIFYFPFPSLPFPIHLYPFHYLSPHLSPILRPHLSPSVPPPISHSAPPTISLSAPHRPISIYFPLYTLESQMFGFGSNSRLICTQHILPGS